MQTRIEENGHGYLTFTDPLQNTAQNVPIFACYRDNQLEGFKISGCPFICETKEELQRLLSDIPHFVNIEKEKAPSLLIQPNYLIRFGYGTMNPEKPKKNEKSKENEMHAFTLSHSRWNAEKNVSEVKHSRIWYDLVTKKFRQDNATLECDTISELIQKSQFASSRNFDSNTTKITLTAGPADPANSASAAAAASTATSTNHFKLTSYEKFLHALQTTQAASTVEYVTTLPAGMASAMSPSKPKMQQLILNTQVPSNAALKNANLSDYASIEQMAEKLGFSLPIAGGSSRGIVFREQQLGNSIELQDLASPSPYTLPTTSKLSGAITRVYFIGHCDAGSSTITGSTGSYSYKYFADTLLKNIDAASPPATLRVSVIACYAGRQSSENPSFAKQFFDYLEPLLKEKFANKINLEVVARTTLVSRTTDLTDYHAQDDYMIMVHRTDKGVTISPVAVAAQDIALERLDPDAPSNPAMTILEANKIAQAAAAAAPAIPMASAAAMAASTQTFSVTTSSASVSSQTASSSVGSAAAAAASIRPASPSANSTLAGRPFHVALTVENLIKKAEEIIDHYIGRCMKGDRVPTPGFFNTGNKYTLYQNLQTAKSELHTKDLTKILESLKMAKVALDKFEESQKNSSKIKNKNIADDYTFSGTRLSGIQSDKDKLKSIIDEIENLSPSSSPRLS